MTGQAPFHVERVRAPHEGHAIETPVTRNACHPLFHVNRMVEVREVGQIMHSRPEDRRSAAEALANDGQLRAVISAHSYTGIEDFGSLRLSDLGLPMLDLFIARQGDREIGYIPYGDMPAVLAPLAARQVVL